MPLFCVMWSLSFGATNSSFNVFPLLKCTWMPYFLPMFLKLSLSPLLYGTVIEVLLVLLLLFVLLMFLFCFGVFFLTSSSVWPMKDTCMLLMLFLHMLTLLLADLHWSRCFFPLCIKELITLYLLAIEWWLSHCKYWFVWVGFLCMEVDKLPSSSTVTRVSRKGNDQSALVFSAVNWIFSSIPFICWNNSSLYVVSRMTKVSSPNLFQRLGGVVLSQGPWFQNAPCIY